MTGIWQCSTVTLPAVILAVDSSLRHAAVAARLVAADGKPQPMIGLPCASALDYIDVMQRLLCDLGVRDAPHRLAIVAERPRGGGSARSGRDQRHRLDYTKASASLAHAAAKRLPLRMPSCVRRGVRCAYVDPIVWQRALGIVLPSKKAGFVPADTKVAALRHCDALGLPCDGDHNVADAMLLLHYACAYPHKVWPLAR